MQSTDQLGYAVKFNLPPRRIISLVPSQTEFLFDIGLDKEIAGITRFCIHPESLVKTKERIGGTKRFQIEKIKAIQPDLIIGNKEENYPEGIEQLKSHFPVWISDIYNLQDAYNMMKELARITGREAKGEDLVNEIQKLFGELRDEILAQKSTKEPTVAYFIWRKPYMVAASNTFIDFMLGIFGVKNIFSNQQRYPKIEPETVSMLKPDFIFLSSEPYSFSEKHFGEFQALSPTSGVVLVDGELFSWYGSRLRFAPGYFRKLRKDLKL